jgi:GNAT superfamily N-acetyltransferase
MFTITAEIDANPADVQVIFNELDAFNRSKTEVEGNYQPLNLFVRDEAGIIVGGLIGNTYWGWLYVNVLWISEALRGQGYGRKLLHQAEAIAIERGCHHAHLDTMSFQALPFYLKEGYTQYGQLDDMPTGHSRYFLQKALR